MRTMRMVEVLVGIGVGSALFACGGGAINSVTKSDTVTVPGTGGGGAGQGGSAIATGGSAGLAGSGSFGGSAGLGGAAGAGRGAGGLGTGGKGGGSNTSTQGGDGRGAGGRAQGQGGAAASPGGLFEAPNPWNQKVDALPKDPTSDAITSWLAQAGGWGTGKMKIDFSIELLTADANTPFQSFTPTGEFYSPDGDAVPFPLPVGGALEGEQGYACTNDGDCHLLVVHPPTKKLYEMWRANVQNGTFYGGSTAVWDLTKSYPANLRGEGCTSADAGGFPVAAMIFSADEIAAGAIAHAIRFILPNNRIRKNTYVHPGTHTTGATSGGANAPPYGVRFRLRSNFPVAQLSPGAQVVAKALQTYGMFLADGGNIALTAQSDRFTQHTWADVGVDALSLQSIQPTDMEVVALGQPIVWSGDCVRN